jgi:hypothetical protein
VNCWMRLLHFFLVEFGRLSFATDKDVAPPGDRRKDAAGFFSIILKREQSAATVRGSYLTYRNV